MGNAVNSVSDEVVGEIIDLSLALDEDKAMASMDRLARATGPLARTTLVGEENIPEGPVLYIGNHSTMALDVMVTAPALQKASGRFVRGMSDEIMYRTPRSRKLVTSMGAIMGHPDIGDAMFSAGKDILLFPGGAYEANKKLEDRYTIQWKQRTGFVRMAARHGVPIVPVGIVGPDEWYSRYFDREDVADSWLGSALRWAGVSEEFIASDQFPVLPRGVFGTLIPRPHPVYICIGEPVETAAYAGKKMTIKRQFAVRDIVKGRLEECIREMLVLSSQRRDKVGLMRKFLSFY